MLLGTPMEGYHLVVRIYNKVPADYEIKDAYLVPWKTLGKCFPPVRKCFEYLTLINSI